MGSFLSYPVTTVIKDLYNSGNFVVGSAEMNGYRTSMEDAHIVLLENGWALCGIFDGHNGNACSNFVADRMKEYVLNISKQVDISTGKFTHDMITKMCYVIDKECEKKIPHNCGTAAIFFIIHSIKDGEALVDICNIGDSRLSVCRPSVGAITTTDDHKPSAKEEHDRIVLAGGYVSEDRVDGQLALSRAFGDFIYKQDAIDVDDQEVLFNQKVIAKPTITRYPIYTEDYILLYCDGVYEGGFTPDEVVEMVNTEITIPESLSDICTKIVEEALDRGSKDNISAMILNILPSDHTNILCARSYEPGRLHGILDPKFRKAYDNMAVRAGTNIKDMANKRKQLLLKKSPTDNTKPRSLINAPSSLITTLLAINNLESSNNSLADRTVLSQGYYLQFFKKGTDDVSSAYYYRLNKKVNGKSVWYNGRNKSLSKYIFYDGYKWIVSDCIGGPPMLSSNIDSKEPYEATEWNNPYVPPLILKQKKIDYKHLSISEMNAELKVIQTYLN